MIAVGRRLGAGVGAGVSGAALAVATHRLLIRAGLAPPLRAQGDGGPSRAELARLLVLAGALHGAGYAVLRPLLPRRPELAGVLYSFVADAVLRVQVNWILRAVGRPPSTWQAHRTPWTVADGLWLALVERLAGTSPGAGQSKGT
jgi:hypothetical protein